MSFYYVTVRRPKADGSGDGWDYRPLRGPYITHEAARAQLDTTRAAAIALDPAAAAYSFGTARCDDYQGPGIFDVLDARHSTDN